MTDNVNFTLNQADCIKTQANFTSTTYYNICNGSTFAVPYGEMDYIFLCGFLLFGIAFLVAALVAAKE